MDALIVSKQMLILFLIMMAGYALRKTGIINDANAKCLSALVVNIFNPALIFSSAISQSSGSPESVYLTFLIAAVSYLLLIALGKVFQRFFSPEKMVRNVYQLLFVFANVGFIGIPLANAMFGPSSLIYVAIFVLEYNLLIYTYGISLTAPRSTTAQSSFSPRALLNMGTVACVAAIVFFLLQIPVPEILSTPISYLGNCATPISLLVIGTSIGAQEKLSVLFTQKKLYIFCILKLLLIPFVGILVFKYLPIPEFISELTVIMLAMPCGSLTLMLVQRAGLDETECCTGIILSTIFSVVTIPLVVLIYNMFP